MGIKGYVVRGTKGARTVYAYGPGMGFGDACEEIPAFAFERLDAAAGARDHMVRLGCEAAIFRVHADGREERLPSYEEALGELERLRAVEALNVGAIDASLTRLGAVTGTIGPMPRHDPRCLIHDGAGCSFEAGCDAGRALMPPSDPLAALEAAERRLLEAGGWTCANNDGRWREASARGWCERHEAIQIARRRLAAKGGA